MKHLIFIKTILLLFVALITVSCSARDKEISFEALPQQAQQFIKQYFPKTECARIVQEKDNGIIEYDVYLNDGTEIEFCTKGVWTSVDCKVYHHAGRNIARSDNDRHRQPLPKRRSV